jgi:hypothetical protein
MDRFPFKDDASKTGSSVRGNPLLAHRERAVAARKAAHERIAREERRAAAALFTRRELKSLAKVAAGIRADLREQAIDCGGDLAAIAEARAAARRKLARALAREAPAFARWRTVRRAHMRAHGKLLDAHIAAAPGGRGHYAWGANVLPADEPEEFSPPFTTWDVQSLQWDDQIVRDDSFARPQIGHLVNNFDYDNDEDTSIVAGLLGILKPAYGESRASCGVGFTTPSAGRLGIGGVFRNVYYRAMLSVEDSFGFSSAVTGVSVGFCFTVLRGNGEVIELSSTLRHTRMDSDGDDRRIVDDGIDDTMDLTASEITTERFEANEALLVLAGSSIMFTSMLDDMHCRGNGLAWWMLKTLRIGMVDF